jgi:hypothetical protein
MRLRVVALVLFLAVASPAASDAAVRWFHSPSGNIQCELVAGEPRGTYAFCQTFRRPRSVTLRRSGAMRVCNGTGCLGNGPENAFTLRYGRSVRVGPFVCTSLRQGMRCLVARTRHGFILSREGLKRV